MRHICYFIKNNSFQIKTISDLNLTILKFPQLLHVSDTYPWILQYIYIRIDRSNFLAARKQRAIRDNDLRWHPRVINIHCGGRLTFNRIKIRAGRENGVRFKLNGVKI